MRTKMITMGLLVGASTLGGCTYTVLGPDGRAPNGAGKYAYDSPAYDDYDVAPPRSTKPIAPDPKPTSPPIDEVDDEPQRDPPKRTPPRRETSAHDEDPPKRTPPSREETAKPRRQAAAKRAREARQARETRER